MKSHVMLLRATYTGIFLDICIDRPDEYVGLERDLSRLLSVLDLDRIELFTLILPTWSKALTRGLDSGCLPSIEGPYSTPRHGQSFPVLFSGLWSRIFTNGGLLVEEPDVCAIRYLQQLLLAAKKIEGIACDDQIVVNTVQSFVDVEASIRLSHCDWGGTVFSADHRTSIDGNVDWAGVTEEDILRNFPDRDSSGIRSRLGVIQRVFDCVASSLGSPFYGELEPQHGPGAIADRGTNASKYQFSHWPAKLEHCFPSDVFGYPNANYWLQPVPRDEPRFLRTTVDSKLIAVPKTMKGPRLIAAEPVSNMWMQQALRAFIERGVGKAGLADAIDFKDQSLSGDLALKSSLDQEYATIDLSDASDRLSLWLVERAFRSNMDLLCAFNAVRTDCVSIEKSKQLPVPIELTGTLRLRKFATQGSALTFPVQTIIYTCIAIGTMIYENLGEEFVTCAMIQEHAKLVRVFGDDIIVPKCNMDEVVESLTLLGFKVNDSKSFGKGYFRESCGVDGYKGVDITPAYVLKPYDQARPASVASLVECSNNFYRKGYWETARLIRETLPEDLREKIPFVRDGSGAFGFIDAIGYARPTKNKSRWNPVLQQLEFLVPTITSKVRKTKHEGDFALHQYFTEKPSPSTHWENGEACRPKLTLRFRWVSEETLKWGSVSKANTTAKG